MQFKSFDFAQIGDYKTVCILAVFRRFLIAKMGESGRFKPKHPYGKWGCIGFLFLRYFNFFYYNVVEGFIVGAGFDVCDMQFMFKARCGKIEG